MSLADWCFVVWILCLIDWLAGLWKWRQERKLTRQVTGDPEAEQSLRKWFGEL